MMKRVGVGGQIKGLKDRGIGVKKGLPQNIRKTKWNEEKGGGKTMAMCENIVQVRIQPL